MNGRVRADVARIVEEFALHEGGAPVRLEPLEGTFLLEFGDLLSSGAIGIAKPPLHDLVPSPFSPAAVMVEERLDRGEMRLVYAHEIGHVVCGHAGSLRVASLGRAWDDKQEKEAWEVAAALLVPMEELVSGDTSAEVAARCEVPVDLVERHPWLWR